MHTRTHTAFLSMMAWFYNDPNRSTHNLFYYHEVQCRTCTNWFRSQLQVVSAGQGHCSCKMVVEQEHENRVGFIHGGMVATLVDVVSSAGLMTSEWAAPGVSVELSISWVYIEMTARITRYDSVMMCCKIDGVRTFSQNLIGTSMTWWQWVFLVSCTRVLVFIFLRFTMYDLFFWTCNARLGSLHWRECHIIPNLPISLKQLFDKLSKINIS